MARGERKQFAIQSTRLVRKKHTRLSNTVIVDEGGGPYTCRIRFDDSLVEFVGGKLPRGVTPFDPAFLQVTLYQGSWEVEARYVQDDTSALLWKTSIRPSWLPDDNGEKP